VTPPQNVPVVMRVATSAEVTRIMFSRKCGD
jgi:hypothetical protein